MSHAGSYYGDLGEKSDRVRHDERERICVRIRTRVCR